MEVSIIRVDYSLITEYIIATTVMSMTYLQREKVVMKCVLDLVEYGINRKKECK